MSSPIIVPLRDDTIRLGQLLKLAGVADDGAAARRAVEDGEVTVDGQVETRRGRQIRPGQVVGYAGRRIEVTGPDA